jgi:hypothetical protein
MNKREIITLAAIIPTALIAPFIVSASFDSGKPVVAVSFTAISQEQFIGCEILLQRTLNDPDSYKRLNTPKDAMATGVLLYTAANAFNSRVQATHSCNAQSAAHELLTYRSASETCTSDSPSCATWTEMALQCERQLAGAPIMVRGVAKGQSACGKAEEYREAVTGIELSTAPGAYEF